MLKERYASAMTLEAFIEQAKAHPELWRAMRKRARIPAEVVERFRSLPAPRYLLVLLEDWCGDAVNTVPVLDKLAGEVPQLELRVLRRDENPDLMDAHLSGTSRAMPVVMILDEDFRELGWWGSRPRPLQAWLDSPEARATGKGESYRDVRRWYARDGGRTTLEEISELILGSSHEARADAAQARVA